MTGWVGTARRLIVGMLAAMLLLTLPPGRTPFEVVALDACSRAPELRATTCRLVPGQGLSDSLADAGGSATYRVDVLTPGSTLNLTLSGGPERATIAVVNWRGDELASAARASATEDTRLSVDLHLPGVYGVRVASSDPSSTEGFQLVAGVQPGGPMPATVFPPPCRASPAV